MAALTETTLLSAMATVLNSAQSVLTVYADSPTLPYSGSYPYGVLTVSDWVETRLEFFGKQVDAVVTLEYIDLLANEQGLDYTVVKATANTTIEALRQAIRNNLNLAVGGTPTVRVAGETIRTVWQRAAQVRDRFGMDLFWVPTTISVSSNPFAG